MSNSGSKIESGRVVIDLKEMLWRLLEQWKAIIVFLIIFTILFLSVTYIEGNRIPDGEERNVVLTPQDQLEQFSQINQEKILSACNMALNINDLNSYVTNAPIMQLNPKKVKSLVGVWLITSDEGKAELLSDIYTDEAIRFEIAEKMAGVFSEECDTEYLAELINMEKNNAEGSALNGTESVFKMTVFMPNEVDEAAVHDAVFSAVKNYSGKISYLGSYSVDLLSDDVVTLSSEYVSDKQTGTFDELSSVYSQRKLAVDALSKDQKTVYNNILQGTNVVVNPSNTVPLISAKRLCLGILLGAVLYIIVFICKVLFSGLIQSSSQIEDLFGIRTLGECYPAKSKKNFVSFMLGDDKISSLRHKGHTDIMQNSGKDVLRNLSKTNLPAAMVNMTLEAGKSLHAYLNGTIDGAECLERMGQSGFSMVVASMSATVGQVVIPIPIVGAVIGSALGYALSSACYGCLVSSLKDAKLSRENRIRIERECQEHIKFIRQCREELEKYFDDRLNFYKQAFYEGFTEISRACDTGDYDGFIGACNKLNSKMGGKNMQFSNTSLLMDLVRMMSILPSSQS